jgi:lipoprotein-releasing system permease protein
VTEPVRAPATRWANIAAITLLVVGLVELLVGLWKLDFLPLASGDLALSLVGWGTFLEVLSALGWTFSISTVAESFKLTHVAGAFVEGVPHFWVGLSMWTLGMGFVAFGVRSQAPAVSAQPSALTLHPRIATWVDLHWGTLAAYGFGLLFAELGFIGTYLALVSKGATQAATPGEVSWGLLFLAGLLLVGLLVTAGRYLGAENRKRPPIVRASLGLVALLFTIARLVSKAAPSGGVSWVVALLVASTVALLLAFAGGFLGAANSKRLSIPEATLALLYFGLPIPGLLTAMHQSQPLMLNVGYRVRELIYLSSLLGDARPELGYWLVTIVLALVGLIGICVGFVLTSSGRLDLRASYELFVSSRHVSVFLGTGDPRLGLTFGVLLLAAFGCWAAPLGVWSYVLAFAFLVAAVATAGMHWKILVGVFLMLLFGIVLPLIGVGIILATEKTVERTRIRHLGKKDPIEAAEALNTLRLSDLTPTMLMTALSVLGVGVGVMALVIVLSVMSGFEEDLQKKILGTNSHGVVLKYSPDMPEYDDVLAKVKKVRGIKGATPFILNEVMISSEGNISGSMIKGIDPETVGSVTDLPDYLQPGGELKWLSEPEKIVAKHPASLDDGLFDDKPAGVDEKGKKLDQPPSTKEKAPELERDPMIEIAKTGETSVLPGIIVGRELAASLKVVVGDRVNVVSPLGGELGPQGPMPKSRPFKVAGIFYSGMYEYDSKFVYILLSEAQTFFNVKGATGLEVKVTDVDNARGTMKQVYDALEGYPYRTKDWGEMNRNLFSALRLEKLVMGLILLIIVIVAACLIVATVIMLVLEKRKEIAVLKALGVPDGGIVKIFLAEGLQIGVAGSVLGLIAGLVWCLFIEKFGLKLDPQVYYIPALPVKIEPFQTALSVVIAILVSFLASIYPALRASKVEPVDGLKSE